MLQVTAPTRRGIMYRRRMSAFLRQPLVIIVKFRNSFRLNVVQARIPASHPDLPPVKPCAFSFSSMSKISP
jgi:hypothetical protein